MVLSGTNSEQLLHARQRSDFLTEIREKYSAFLLFGVLFLVGTAAGAVCARFFSFSALERLDFIFAGNYEARLADTLVGVFISSAASSFLFIFLCFILGLSAWGMFFLPLVPVFRGFGLGLTGGFLCAAYGFKGFCFHALILLPGAFICALSIIFACKEGMQFSRSVFRGLTQKGKDEALNASGYCTRFAIIVLIELSSAAIDSVCQLLFSGWFSF